MHFKSKEWKSDLISLFHFIFFHNFSKYRKGKIKTEGMAIEIRIKQWNLLLMIYLTTYERNHLK